jgi:hypothetical protein
MRRQAHFIGRLENSIVNLLGLTRARSDGVAHLEGSAKRQRFSGSRIVTDRGQYLPLTFSRRSLFLLRHGSPGLRLARLLELNDENASVSVSPMFSPM